MFQEETQPTINLALLKRQIDRKVNKILTLLGEGCNFEAEMDRVSLSDYCCQTEFEKNIDLPTSHSLSTISVDTGDLNDLEIEGFLPNGELEVKVPSLTTREAFSKSKNCGERMHTIGSTECDISVHSNKLPNISVKESQSNPLFEETIRKRKLNIQPEKMKIIEPRGKVSVSNLQKFEEEVKKISSKERSENLQSYNRRLKMINGLVQAGQKSTKK